MSLAPGSRLGPYEIVGMLGAGGMGEVYRAKDPKLGREVAVKVLPESFAADPDHLRRFEQEARTTGALNHPNILAVYDLGRHGDSPFLVMELLEGETLRERLAGRPLPSRKAVEIALQIARGLSAAHEQGVLHRDLKPENVFLCRDGRVKILDFGLAKQQAVRIGQESATRTMLSAPGTVVGTSGYMSPEQVQGEALDARSDLFSLGVVLWEMLAGRGPFQRGSAVETMHAVLKDDPPDLDPALKVPPGLARIVDTCLAKDKAGRFHSAHDLAFALETLSGSGTGSTRLPALRTRRIGWALPAAAGAALVLVAGLLAWARQWPPFRPPKQPTFTRLTFQPGQIRGARFTPDGKEAVFDLAAEDGRPQVLSVKLDTLDTRPLGIQGTVLYLTRGGDLGVALNARNDDEYDSVGDLAKAPPGGSAPKPAYKDVKVADQAPDGQLALITTKDYPGSLECPPGQRRWTAAQGAGLRFSPDGRHLASSARRIQVLDPATGKVQRLGQPYRNLDGFAWKGEEIWYSAGDLDTQQSLRAVDLQGHERLVLETPGRFRLLDVDERGRALMAQEEFRVGVLHWGPGSERPKDLTWRDSAFLYFLSRDGARVLFAGSSRRDRKDDRSTFLRGLDGPPQLVNDGWYSALSPDGAWIATVYNDAEPKLGLHSTGAEPERFIALPGLRSLDTAAWTPDNRALLLSGNEPKKPGRIFLLPLDGGALRPLTPEGFHCVNWGTLDLAPDGRRFLAEGPHGLAIFDLQDPGRPPETVRAFQGRFLGWTADSRRFFVLPKGSLPLEVWEFDPRTGARTPHRTFHADGHPGAEVMPWASRITPDGKTLAVTYFRKPSTLYLVEGLK